MGFALPLQLPDRAVGSYPTISPLPPPSHEAKGSGGMFSVALSFRCQNPMLWGILSFGARTFLTKKGKTNLGAAIQSTP